jgi:hypothetical protein
VLLYYAAGGGLGHVTRARAFLHGASLDGVILTAAAVDGIDTLVIPEPLRRDLPAYREWLRGRGAEHIILDTFPAGLFHEFDDLELSCTFDYVARYLAWPRYAKMSNPPRFGTTHVLEPLHEEQERFIAERSAQIDRAPKLIDPESAVTVHSIESPYTLVVHSGPAAEVEELIDYARFAAKTEGETSQRIVVATRATINASDVIVVDAYPATSLAAGATRIVTGAGFNCMRQFGGDPRHHAVPFPRRYDDQFIRAARARSYRSSETSIRSNCAPSNLTAR